MIGLNKIMYCYRYHLGRPDAEGRTIDAVSIASIYKQYFNSHSEANAKNLCFLIQVKIVDFLRSSILDCCNTIQQFVRLKNVALSAAEHLGDLDLG